MRLAITARARRFPPLARNVFLFTAAFSFLFLLMDRLVGVYDEGIILTASMLVSAGELIHRDFYANYGPGEFYLLAWLFELFGHKVMVERMLDLSVRAAILVLVYRACRPYAQRRISWLAAAACACWLATVGNAGYPVYPSMLLAIGSTWLVVRVLSGEPGTAATREAVLAGLLAGAVGLFRYDVGMFTFAAHGMTAVLVTLLQRRQPMGLPLRPALLGYALGFAVPGVALGLSYAVQGALPALVHDVIAFPARYYAATRSLPFPSLRGVRWLEKLSLLSIYLPLLIAFAVLVGGLLERRLFVPQQLATEEGTDKRRAKAVFVIAFAFLSLLFFCKGVVRISLEHVQLSLIPAVMALTVYAALVDRRRPWVRLGIGALLVLTVSAALATAMLRAGDHHRVLWALDWLSGYARGRPGFVLEKTPADRLAAQPSQSLLLLNPDRDPALDYLARHAGPQARIFVGLAHHDRIYINDVSIYFLAQKLPLTKWHHFDPGLQNSLAVQRQIVADFERTRPLYIWLESTWESTNEPNQSRLSSGVHLLDAHIAAHYAPEKTFGKVAILRRKTAPDA
jgi:hypothetical protein